MFCVNACQRVTSTGDIKNQLYRTTHSVDTCQPVSSATLSLPSRLLNKESQGLLNKEWQGWRIYMGLSTWTSIHWGFDQS